MKTEYLQSKNQQSKIPAIGQPWKHETGEEIFIRIGDEEGAKALDYKAADRFFSVSLGSGDVRFTLIDTSNRIILLKPVGGVIKFEEEN